MFYNDDHPGEPYLQLEDQISLTSDCLKQMGYKALAQSINLSNNLEVINDFLSITISLARSSKRADLIEKLGFAGFIYS